MSADPVRLFEANSEAPDVLRGLLQEARNVGPNVEQTARLAAKLGPAFGAAAGGSAVALSGGAKLVVALAMSGVVAGGILWYRSAEPVTTRAIPSVQQVVARPAPEQPRSEVAAPETEALPSATDTPGKPGAQPVPKVSEAALLERARAALKSNPAAALKITREHAERFPKGALAQEREIIAIDALSRLKRTGEAEGRAADFKKDYPDSPHQRKLETLKK